MRQMFVRVSVVLGKRFEHNLAEEGGCMLHCDSLVFAAGASIHPADQVPCVLGSHSAGQYAGLKSTQTATGSMA